MTIGINDAGTWRTPTGVYVNDAGTWRTITNVYVNDAGTWREVFTGDTFNTTNVDVQELNLGNAAAYFNMLSNGTITEFTNLGGTVGHGNWVTPTSSAANYQVRATLLTGALSSGITGSWLTMTSNQAWACADSAGITQATLTIEIRDTATSTVRATFNVSLYADGSQSG